MTPTHPTSLVPELEAVDGFLEVGVAYVHVAVAHPVHVEVMFRPDLLHSDDPGLVLARGARRAVLRSGVAGLSAGPSGSAPNTDSAARAAWSLGHGLATLRLTGLPPTTDLAGLTRAALNQLFAGPKDSADPGPPRARGWRCGCTAGRLRARSARRSPHRPTTSFRHNHGPRRGRC